ncbi:MAG: hypothetical protein ALECFALPRED_005948 [Alectoria fallacina]|uniref:Fork-head domain-containing protein n=1 Tax=Alectoria fallacina TaxID=1903189 RepID=A0A8H3G2A9_9LECA|nr:MAG: hypothetical protein ALECFALPRED_005948 [Alectoria fallacina]
MPALLVNRASALSDHSHDALHHLPSQAYMSPESSLTWPNSEQLATLGHTSFGYRTEPSSSAIHARTCFGNVEDQAKGEDKWGNGPHQQLPTPFSLSSSSFNNNSFETDQGLAPSAQSNSAIQRPILSIPTHQSQLPPWTDFTVANAFEEPRARPRYNPPQAYAYDTATSFGPSLYATSSDPRTSTQPRLHHSFRGTERCGPQDSESESEGKQGEPPYAKLIYRALMDAPEHQMVLKDIYDWIAQNTDKARDPAFKGWQNSVRHNLSMNGAFTKVPHVDPSNKAKKGFIWVLEPSAVGAGIESTTRYRQKTIGKRSDNIDQADPKRQRSGRKGGRAARKSAKMRRSALLDHDSRYARYPKSEPKMTYNSLPHEPLRQTSPHQNWNGTSGLPYYLTPPLSSTQPSFPENDIYDYGAMTENQETQQNETVYDRQDLPLFDHPFASGCESMQHEGSGIIKFEDHYLANKLTAFT